MQERDRERLHKIGTSSLQQANSPLQSRKKRSFSLPSFRRSSASAGDKRQEVVTSAEEAARIQKAAAWQWYTRGVGDAVLPTKRPLVGKSLPAYQAPMDDKMFVDRISKGGESIKNNVLQKKPLEPPLTQPLRAASRFKSEASFAKVIPTSGTPSAPSAAPNSTPLYDEFELSGLRSQMADFVQRLQQHQAKDNEHTSPAVVDHQKAKLLHRADVDGPAVFDHQKAKSLHRADVDGGSLLPAAASGPNADQPPPSAAATAMANYHQLTKPPPASAAPVPFRMRPFSALHRLFRKVVSGSILKSTTNSPVMIISSPEVYEPKVLLPMEEEELNSQYHYHHYIHHHHHHYHYGQSPEEGAGAIIRSRRRHSESSGIRPLIPSSWEAELSEEEDQAIERSPIEAYLTLRRRRHSESFAEHLTPKKAAAFDEEQEMKGKPVKAALPLQLPRRYNSERFSPNKMPTMDRKELAQPAAGGEDEFDEGHMNIKIRRHSAENNREGEAIERKEEEARKSGTYTLSGAPDGATPAKTLVRRRHSEGLLQRPEGVQYEMGKRTPSPGRPYWHSPSARYVEDVLDRQIGASAAAPAPPRRPRPPRDLPPIYPV